MTETAAPPFLSLHEFATIAGRLRWFEQRLFEVLGGWVVDEPDPDARLLFHRHSFHAAWHADLWAGLVPLLPDRPLDAVTRPASPEVATLVRELGAVQGGGRTLERLALAYMVLLPGLEGVYDAIERNASPVCDGPAIRVTRILLHDLRADAAAGAELLDARVGAAADADAVITSARARGDRLVACGGPVGTLDD